METDSLPARALRLGLLQYGVTRIDSLDAYAAKLDRLVAEGAAGADMLVMPEYAPMEVAAAFTRGADAWQERDAVCDRVPALLDIMQATARRHAVWLVPGSFTCRDDTGVRNRAPLIDPEGYVRFQEKRVMTRFETESWGVSAGAEPTAFATPWGILGIAICYDVEFPTLVRAQVAAGAWLILVPTCTDTRHGFNRVRVSAQARALENQCFVAVAPTVGIAPWLATLDENCGHAGIYGPIDTGYSDDGVIVEGKADEPGWVFATLDPSGLRRVRQQGAVRNYHDWPDIISPSPVL